MAQIKETTSNIDEWGTRRGTTTTITQLVKPPKAKTTKEPKPSTVNLSGRDASGELADIINTKETPTMAYDATTKQMEVVPVGKTPRQYTEEKKASEKVRINNQERALKKQSDDLNNNYGAAMFELFKNKDPEIRNKSKELMNEYNAKRQEAGLVNFTQEDINTFNNTLMHTTAPGAIGIVKELVTGDGSRAQKIHQNTIDNVATYNPMAIIDEDPETGEVFVYNGTNRVYLNVDTETAWQTFIGGLDKTKYTLGLGIGGSLVGVFGGGAGVYAGFASGSGAGGIKDTVANVEAIDNSLKKITGGKGVKEVYDNNAKIMLDAGNFLTGASTVVLEGRDPNEFLKNIANNNGLMNEQVTAAGREVTDAIMLQGLTDVVGYVGKAAIKAWKGRSVSSVKIPSKISAAASNVLTKVEDNLPEGTRSLATAGLQKVKNGAQRAKAVSGAAVKGGLTHAVVGFGGAMVDPTGGILSHTAGFILGARTARNSYKNSMTDYFSAQEAKGAGLATANSKYTFSPSKFIENYLGGDFIDPSYSTTLKARLAQFGITLNGSLQQNQAAMALLNSTNNTEYIKILAREYPQVAVNLRSNLEYINKRILNDINNIIPKNKAYSIDTILNDIKANYSNSLATLEAFGELAQRANLKVENPTELLRMYNTAVKGLNSGKQLTELELPTSLVKASKANVNNMYSNSTLIKAGSATEKELDILLGDSAYMSPTELLKMKANLSAISDSELKNSPLLSQIKIATDLAIKDMLKEAPEDLKITFESLVPEVIKNLTNFEALGYNKVFKQLLKEPNPDKVAAKLLDAAKESKSLQGTQELLQLSQHLSPNARVQLEGILLNKVIDNAISESSSAAKNFLDATKAYKQLSSLQLVTPEARAIKELLREYTLAIKDPVGLVQNLTKFRQPELGSGIGTSFINRMHVMMTTKGIKTLKNLLLPSYNSGQWRLVTLASKAIANPMNAEARNNLNTLYSTLLAKQSKTAEDMLQINKIEEINSYLSETAKQLYNGTLPSIENTTLPHITSVAKLENLTNLKAAELLQVPYSEVSKNIDIMLDDVVAHSNKLKTLLEQQQTTIDEIATANNIIEKFNASVPPMYKNSTLPKFTEETYMERLPAVLEKSTAIEEEAVKNIAKNEEATQAMAKSAEQVVESTNKIPTPVKVAGAAVGLGAASAGASELDSNNEGWGNTLGLLGAFAISGYAGSKLLKKFYGNGPKGGLLAPAMQLNATTSKALDNLKTSINKMFIPASATKNLPELNKPLDKAKELYKRGKSDFDIWVSTGMYRDPVSLNWYAFIPPTDSIDIAKVANHIDITRETTIRLSEIYKNDIAYQVLPELNNYYVRFIPNGKGYEGLLNIEKKEIELVPPVSLINKFKNGNSNAGIKASDGIKETLRHEIQHAIDQAFGESYGNAADNVRFILNSYLSTLRNSSEPNTLRFLSTPLKWIADTTAHYSPSLQPSESLQKFIQGYVSSNKSNAELKNLFGLLNEEDLNKICKLVYTINQGEIRARLAEEAAGYSKKLSALDNSLEAIEARYAKGIPTAWEEPSGKYTLLQGTTQFEVDTRYTPRFKAGDDIIVQPAAVKIEQGSNINLKETFNLDSENLKEIYRDAVSSRRDPLRWIFQNDSHYLVFNKPKNGTTGTMTVSFIEKATGKKYVSPPFKEVLKDKSMFDSTKTEDWIETMVEYLEGFIKGKPITKNPKAANKAKELTGVENRTKAPSKQMDFREALALKQKKLEEKKATQDKWLSETLNKINK